MAGRLSNKRCLIVGGTGGIGLASARRFLEEGAAVFLTGLKEDEGPAALRALEGVGSVRFRACDAGNAREVLGLFEAVLGAFGGLDVLFHVAGISGRRFGDGPLHECTDQAWDRTLQANLTGVFLTNRAALGQFLKQGRGGVILNMASVLALDPSPRYFDAAAYSASKAGIIGLTRLAAASYAPDSIRVNALAPGLTDTPMAARALHDRHIQAFLETKQPLSRGPAAAQDCAEAAVFLCGDESRLITGTILPVDGGWCLSEGQLPGRR